MSLTAKKISLQTVISPSINLYHPYNNEGWYETSDITRLLTMKNLIWSGVHVSNFIPNFRCAVFHIVNTNTERTCFNGTSPILLVIEGLKILFHRHHWCLLSSLLCTFSYFKQHFILLKASMGWKGKVLLCYPR